MNSLKTLVIVALLGAVGYGVYVSITRSPRQAAPDGGEAPAWTGGGAQAQTPGPSVSLPQSPGAGAAAGASSGAGNLAPGSLNGRKLPPLPPEVTGPAAATAGAAPPAPRVIPPPGHPALADAEPPATAIPPPTGIVPAGSAAAGTAPAGPSAAGGAASLSGELAATFGAFMQSVQTKLDEGKLDEALQTLSMVYKIPDLPPAEARQVTRLLDQLAATVIYSRQHLLERPHTVEPGETPDAIAQKYSVPWELLSRINGIRNPRNLQPGQQLKVVRGPFAAVVSLEKGELTLLLPGVQGDRYAGRFPLSVSREQAPPPGDYTVARVMPADPQQAVPAFIDLGNRTGIVGYPKDVPPSDARVPLGLSYQDFEDVSGILAAGSKVIIQR